MIVVTGRVLSAGYPAEYPAGTQGSEQQPYMGEVWQHACFQVLTRALQRAPKGGRRHRFEIQSVLARNRAVRQVGCAERCGFLNLPCWSLKKWQFDRTPQSTDRQLVREKSSDLFKMRQQRSL